MQNKFLPGVLLVVLVAIANTASVDLRGWASALQKLASINFYKQALVYEQAILQEGLPVLHLPSYDPFITDAEYKIFQESCGNYTHIEILLKDFNVTGYSHFDIDTAELDVEAMKATPSLYQDKTAITNDHLRATAVDSAGRILSCTCTHVEFGVLGTTFNSIKELEVVDTILQVKRFDLILQSNLVYLYEPEGCTGDLEIVDTVSDVLIERLAHLEFDVLPEKLNKLASTITNVLNDIFALRNITYDVDSVSAHDSLQPQHQIRQLGHKLTETDVNMPDEVIRQFRTRADHEVSTKNSKNNPIEITWTKN